MIRSLAIFFPLFFSAIFTLFAQSSGSVAGGFANEDALRRALGLSLGAARVYAKDYGFSYAGYGELIYENHSEISNQGTAVDKIEGVTLARGVLFLGYRISDRVVLNSELRVDRDVIDSTDAKASLDLAYIDYLMSPALTFRAGIVLVPMGLINEFHQPTEYLGTRPGFGDIFTIPSIWHALGFGIAGHKWGFDYRAYVVNGLNAAKFTEFGLRDGREITADTISHPSFVVRAEYNFFPGALLGGSYYIGNAGIFGLEEPVDLKIHITLKEFHGEFRWKGVFARAQYAKALLHSTPELNRILKKTGLHGVGKRMVGGYVEGGFDFFAYKKNGTMLMPYLRGEASNSQDALPPPSLDLGLIKNWFVDFIIWVAGVEYRPFPALSIKPEYERIHDQNQIGWNEFHLGVSYTF